MVASAVDRVHGHTSQAANRRIETQIADRVRWHARHPEGIDRRLHELDQEWDIERVLQANASTLIFAGIMLGAAVDKRWLALPAFVAAFLFQHAIQGWCPPLPILRQMGFRTAREIDTERYALKALRGDFGPIGPGPHEHDTRASHALQAARL